MALTEELRKSILFAAVQGGLTEHDDSDASALTHFQSEKIICVEYSPYIVPDNWCVLSLDSIVDIKNGFTPKRSIKDFWDKDEIPWFTVEDVNTQGHIICSTNQYITYQALGKSTDRIIPADTVLLCCTSATIGNYALTKIPLTTNQQWNGLVIKNEHKNFICSEYLLCWVQTLKEKLISMGSSTTFPFVSIKKLSSLPVPIPPIEEQQRIVDRVNVLMEKLDEFSEIEQQLIALKANFPADLRGAILQAAMQGKLTEQLHSDSDVHDMLQSIKKAKNELLKDGVISRDSSCKISAYVVDDIDLISIPPSWEWVKLGELCTRIGAGSTPVGGSKVYVPTGIKFLREQNIHNDGLCYDGIVYITDKINNSMPGSQVQAKDILLNITGASIGRNSLVPDDFDIANVNQHVLIIRLVDPRFRQYVHWCLCSPLIFNQMMSEQKGDKPGLSATRVSNFLLPIPPIEEQQRIVERLDALLPLCDELV